MDFSRPAVSIVVMASLPIVAVVDDDESVRVSLQSLLRSVGFCVEVFSSAEEFLNSDVPSNTKCLILDVGMPGMDGFELQSRLEDGQYEIPVIFITAHNDEEVHQRALKVGAVDYLLKPFSKEALLNAVRVGLNK
jgi:FixJ family two-component response regulator